MLERLDGEKRSAWLARLVCRLHGAAQPALRASLVACLLRPLGTLGTAGVAAGAFSLALYRQGSGGALAALDDLAWFSNEQIFELARFVEQVSPDALQEVARLVAQRPIGLAGFSLSAALLLMRAVQSGPPRRAP